MARYASLFPSVQAAEQAADALRDWDPGDQVTAQVVSEEIWRASFESDQNGDPGSSPAPRDPDTYLDLWIDDATVKTFAKGLADGGAVLVIDVPDELSKQALKIVKDNQGKFE
jgi:hypothetical protein